MYIIFNYNSSKAFQEVASRLPIVTNILDAAMQYSREGDVSEDYYKGVKQAVKACQRKAKKLDDLFHKIKA